MGWLTMDDLAGLGRAYFGPGSTGAKPQLGPPKQAPRPAPKPHPVKPPQGVGPSPRFLQLPSGVPTRGGRPTSTPKKHPSYEGFKPRVPTQPRYEGGDPRDTPPSYAPPRRVYDPSIFTSGQGVFRSQAPQRQVSQAPVPGTWAWHHAQTDYQAIKTAALSNSPYGRPASGGAGYTPATAFYTGS